jgi:hypothetical protein
MTARFDLEQQIMETWQIIDDLKLFREVLDSEEFTGLDAGFTDKIDNFVLALITIYGYRFDKTFRVFEKVCEEARYEKLV